MKNAYAFAGVALVLSAFSAVSLAQSVGSLAGSWSGKGTIAAITGKRETASCKISYSKTSSSAYKLNAKCASTSGKADQSATVRPSGKGEYTGSFYNAKHNAHGKISIKMSGNRQTLVMTSDQGSATLSLKRR